MSKQKEHDHVYWTYLFQEISVVIFPLRLKFLYQHVQQTKGICAIAHNNATQTNNNQFWSGRVQNKVQKRSIKQSTEYKSTG